MIDQWNNAILENVMDQDNNVIPDKNLDQDALKTKLATDIRERVSLRCARMHKNKAIERFEDALVYYLLGKQLSRIKTKADQ